VRTRQGPRRGRDSRAPCAPERRDPDRDGDRAAGGLHARRRDRRRDDLRAAGARPDDARRRARAELPGRAERAPGRGRDVHAGQPRDRRALRSHRPEAAAAMSGRSAVAATGLAIVALLALLAVAAPLVLPGSPTAIASAAALRAPTVIEPFGMDDLGRSVLSRVIHGYRVSLAV